MKISFKSCARLLSSTLICLLIVGLDSCNQGHEPVNPARSGARSASATSDEPIDHGCDPATQIYDPTLGICVERTSGNNCNSVDPNTRYTWSRNMAIGRYGQDAGPVFDQVAADNTSPYSAIDAAGLTPYSNQILNAVVDASNAYVNSTTPGDAYNSSTYLSYLNSYLDPIKNSITNNGSLSQNQRDILLQGFVAINDYFYTISGDVETNLECYPDPDGLSTSSFNGQMMTQSWVGNFLKKAVNVVATIVVNVVVNTFKYAIEAVGGVITSSIFFVPVGLVAGAAYGAIYGLFKGVIDASRKNYVCVFQGVGSCNSI